MPRSAPFSELEARTAIANATCWADALRALGYTPRGSNYLTLKRWATAWNIATAHFDPHAGRRRAGRSREKPLEEVLVEHSRYGRDSLKRRLLESGLKSRVCEMCGQGDTWRGKPMSLILDHINGVSDDNRLENLRIVCPNCNATLQTHCGRNVPRKRICPGCHTSFAPRHVRHRYCSRKCWGAVCGEAFRGVPRPERRKVPRPSREQLAEDLSSMSVLAAGRKYGVSDNAVRKWIRSYESATRKERDRQLE